MHDAEIIPLVQPSTRQRSRRRWLAVLVLAIAAGGGAALAWLTFADSGTVQYATVPVTRGPITRSVTATGTVNPEMTIIVGSYVSGVILDLYCDYNTEVKKGQVCAKIDPRPYETVVNQAKANLAIAKAQLLKDQAGLGYAKITLERNERLVETHAVSQDAVDNSRSAYEQAEAQVALDKATVEQRQAELESAQVNLDYTNIISPVNGTVVSRNVTMGQTVAASFQTPTLFLIASDLQKMEVDTNVSESDIGGLKEGNQATFTVDAFPKRTFSGKVTQVRQSPQTVQNVVTFDVVVSVANSDLALKPGMTAAARIVVDQRVEAVRVPSQALRFKPAGVSVPRAESAADTTEAQLWMLREGKAVAAPVVIGLDDESFAEIVVGNVKPGDEVIIAERRDAAGHGVLPPRL
ncbi:MAG: efflux RND transporter periplasmic adaptor subunit [Bradyrhizobiaceae bacterium]|nr:efflux RND transporter periplasmic adaptor subunit [Bradyrhizobiaceae bacterium]